MANLKLDCLIVDDEPLAQEVLENYISRTPSLRLAGKCSNVIEATEFIKNHQIDVLFLDIQMPEVTGIEFIKTISRPPVVIFTTAHSNYALEGFDLNVQDYLLKPISYERFSKTVEKIENFFRLKNKEVVSEENDANYMFVKSDQKLIKVFYDEIIFIEALADYVKIHTPQKRIVTLQTMKNLEEKLPSAKFRRVHRSYIVGLEKIKAVSGNQIDTEIQAIPIGKNYKDEFFDHLGRVNILR